MTKIPFIPENAPFSPEQRLWLNGYLAGLFSDASAAERAMAGLDAAAAAAAKPLVVLYGPNGSPGPDSPFNAPMVVAQGKKNYVVEITGPLTAALSCTDALLLEYTDGKPASEVGWGRLDSKTLTDLLTLHELFFDLADRISVMLHGKLVGTVNKTEVTTDEVLAMIIIGKLPAEVTQTELAQLHAS